MTTAETTKVGDVKEQILDKIVEDLAGDLNDNGAIVGQLAAAYRQLADAN
jgi:hypothetical protein